jgi:hypothetical protein
MKSKSLKLFNELINLDTKDCISWPLPLSNSGYGIVSFGKRSFLAHRLSYSNAFCKDIEDIKSMEIHHKCENKSCINPKHLECLKPSEHRSKHKIFFSDEQIIKIRLDPRDLREIARNYSCSRTLIKQIRSKAIYSHVDPDGDVFQHRRKFSDKEVVDIRLSRSSQKKLAKEYGCDPKTIAKIKYKKIYSHVDPSGENFINTLGYTGKFSEEEIKKIKSDNRIHRLVAEEYGCSRSLISLIKSRYK